MKNIEICDLNMHINTYNFLVINGYENLSEIAFDLESIKNGTKKVRYSTKKIIRELEELIKANTNKYQILDYC